MTNAPVPPPTDGGDEFDDLVTGAQELPPAGPALNAAQLEVLDELGARRAERPLFDHGLRAELRALLEEELGDAARGLAEPLHVSKHRLTQVHGCEARFVAEADEPFEVTVPIARGSVAHKAIELSVHWRGEPVALELVDEAIARLIVSDSWLADFLARCSEVEHAELRAEAGERVTKFLECWPPLDRRWAPVTESRLRVELVDGLVVLQGKVDLTLGRAAGQTAGKVIVDFKSGGFAVHHIDDLRFYALLDTIRLGTPPRRLASYYLDQGRFHAEDVTIALLHTAVMRAADGARRLLALAAGDEPRRKPGVGCRWCPILSTCEPGQASIGQDGLGHDGHGEDDRPI